jgi:hypothetical protein
MWAFPHLWLGHHEEQQCPVWLLQNPCCTDSCDALTRPSLTLAESELMLMLQMKEEWESEAPAEKPLCMDSCICHYPEPGILNKHSREPGKHGLPPPF